MNYSTVNNLIWCGEDKVAFNCDVTFESLGTVPFCCSVNDLVDHAQEIWQRAMAGEFGPIAEFVPPPPPIEVTSTPSSGEIPQSVL